MNRFRSGSDGSGRHHAQGSIACILGIVNHSRGGRGGRGGRVAGMAGVEEVSGYNAENTLVEL